MAKSTPDTVGTLVDTIRVELSTRFLEHFSEQLYSSPQKAFEELISNGWDAGASIVDVQIAPDLSAHGATMAVLDNGISMDQAGLRALWHIAFSPKLEEPVHQGRPVIGKFGIGKLATYVLAKKLTYICKADDGTIRRVTMDYGQIDQQSGTDPTRLINDLRLPVFEITQADVAKTLDAVNGGGRLSRLIESNFLENTEHEKLETVERGGNEFGGVPTEPTQPEGKTWTLVVLSDLKPVGRGLKIGILRRMLVAALPFGSEMSIYLNKDLLRSPKMNAPIVDKWRIGPDLDIDYIDLVEDSNAGEGDAEDNDVPPAPADTQDSARERILIMSGTDPYPFIELPGIGRVTGLAKLFEDKISGGKSENRGASNGFHVNVLGRVVNQRDPSFGEKNLSHAAWARFRMAVRADGLNEYLTTNREQFMERRDLAIFRAFLRKVFNKARTVYDNDPNSEIPDGGDVLVQSLGVLSLNSLRSVVSETLRTQAALPDLFDERDIEDREAKHQSWRENTADNIRNALGKVRFGEFPDSSFAKFKISDNTIVVNKGHPFVMEHSRRKAEKELVRTIAMVSLLSDIYALDIGIDAGMLNDVRAYRDKLMCFQAMRRRKSGSYIASLLLKTQHKSKSSKLLEAVVSDALRYLGFDVLDLAKPGEPEGIASAHPIPTIPDPTDSYPAAPLYSFTFDAKSSKEKVAQTNNIRLDAVAQHRKRYEADHALVIAPGFSKGALAERADQQQVTPMTARDLGQLLEYTAKYGAISVTKFREVLNLYSPEEVTAWVTALGDELKSNRKLTIDVFLQALNKLKGQIPDALSASTIAHTCRKELGVNGVFEEHVVALVRGLHVIVPDLVGINITSRNVVVNASAERVAEAVKVQLEKLNAGADGDSDS